MFSFQCRNCVKYPIHPHSIFLVEISNFPGFKSSSDCCSKSMTNLVVKIQLQPQIKSAKPPNSLQPKQIIQIWLNPPKNQPNKTPNPPNKNQRSLPNLPSEIPTWQKKIDGTGWRPQVISWFITPSKYRYLRIIH